MSTDQKNDNPITGGEHDLSDNVIQQPEDDDFRDVDTANELASMAVLAQSKEVKRNPSN
jgi:hypothetical protein